MPVNGIVSGVGFDVDKHFSNFPQGSRELAQVFVDETLKVGGTAPFVTPDGVGVGFHPNFVWIERIKSRRDGVTVSFYGLPRRHGNHHLLRKSRANYSRAYVRTQVELTSLLPEIKAAYDLQRAR